MVPISALPSPCSYRAPNLTTSITASLSSLRLPQSRVVPPGLSWPCFSSFGLRHTACRGPNAVAPAATANTLTPAAAAVLAAAASRLAGNSNAENISASAHHTTRQGQGAPTVSSPSTSQQQQQQQQQSTQPQAHLEGRLLRLSLGPLPLLEQRFTVGCCPTSSAVSSRLGTMPQGGSSGDGSQQAGGPGESPPSYHEHGIPCRGQQSVRQGTLWAAGSLCCRGQWYLCMPSVSLYAIQLGWASSHIPGREATLPRKQDQLLVPLFQCLPKAAVCCLPYRLLSYPGFDQSPCALCVNDLQAPIPSSWWRLWMWTR
jgi:hypothetical protein